MLYSLIAWTRNIEYFQFIDLKSTEYVRVDWCMNIKSVVLNSICESLCRFYEIFIIMIFWWWFSYLWLLKTSLSFLDLSWLSIYFLFSWCLETTECHWCCNFFPLISLFADIYITTSSTFVEVGRTITVICNATAIDFPMGDIDWFIDGHKVRENSRTTIRKYSSFVEKMVSSNLTITHAQLEDAGTYVCRTSESQITNIKIHVLSGKDSVFDFTLLYMLQLWQLIA